MFENAKCIGTLSPKHNFCYLLFFKNALNVFKLSSRNNLFQINSQYTRFTLDSLLVWAFERRPKPLNQVLSVTFKVTLFLPGTNYKAVIDPFCNKAGKRSNHPPLYYPIYYPTSCDHTVTLAQK